MRLRPSFPSAPMMMLRLRLATLACVVTLATILSSIPSLRRTAHEASIHAVSFHMPSLLRTTHESTMRDGWAPRMQAPPGGFPASSAAACARLADGGATDTHELPPSFAVVRSALAAHVATPAALSPEQVTLTRRGFAAVFSVQSYATPSKALAALEAMGASPHLLRALLGALAILTSTGRLMPCDGDELLLQAAVAAHSQPGGAAVRVASVLFNSNEILPNMIFQLLQLATALPHGALFISIYESGSSDQTALWLHLLQLLLCPLQVPYRIVIGGKLQRARDDATERAMDRIQFLAQVRNAALLPLLTGELGPQAQQGNGSSRQQMGGVAGGADGGRPGKGADGKVVFVNDVFFCMRDLLRLVMLHQDIACGLDLHTEGIFLPPDPRKLWFYDSWVARDINGDMITGSFPEMSDPASSASARAGLPFPVYCCWNGMAALNMEPLLRGVRVRSGLPGECRASECSLVCDDFHRLGFNRVVIDPTVLTTYRLHHAQAVRYVRSTFDPKLELQETIWAQVVAHGPVPVRRANTSNVLCCSKATDSDRIPWGKCHRRDVFAENFTRQFLEHPRGIE